MTDAKDAELEIRTMRPEDWPLVASIYEAGIATGNATFETEAPPWDSWDRDHLDEPRLVASRGGAAVGWAALSPVSDRCVYQGVAEISVYVDPAATRQGVGRALLRALVEASEEAGIWTLQTGIFPENTASLTLHQGCGFRIVGRRERIGRMGDRWRDVVFLERRSPTI